MSMSDTAAPRPESGAAACGGPNGLRANHRK